MFYRLPDVLQTSNIFCGALECYKFQKESFKLLTTQVLINKLHLLNTNSMTIVYFRFLGN